MSKAMQLVNFRAGILNVGGLALGSMHLQFTNITLREMKLERFVQATDVCSRHRTYLLYPFHYPHRENIEKYIREINMCTGNQSKKNGGSEIQK